MRLDEAQEEAVRTDARTAIVIAGPGSGKTAVMTARIERLLASGVAEDSILALTFTIRAAGELRARISKECNRTLSCAMTFHAFAYELAARQRAIALASPSQLRAIVKTALRAFPGLAMRQALSEISGARLDPHVSPFVAAYKSALHGGGFVDFDDLLIMARDALLAPSGSRRMWTHILVDEYQDTNDIQDEILDLLVASGASLFVIGDPDQSIYRFRGASGDSFSRLRARFPHARTFSLSRNYRSSLSVQRLSHAVMGRRGPDPDPSFFVPVLLSAPRADVEAREIVRCIKSLTGATDFLDHDSGAYRDAGEYDCSDIAILSRTRAQGAELAMTLAGAGIPHTLVGGRSLVEYPEVAALVSIISKTMSAPTLSSLIEECFRSRRAYVELFRKNSQGARRQQDRLRAFVSWAYSFDSLPFEAAREAFLRETASASSEPYVGGAGVRLMTAHAAKGLEFSVVIIAGVEDGFFPYADTHAADVDEERRLLYVAITRAKERVYLFASDRRMIRGRSVERTVSPFLSPLDDGVLARRFAQRPKPARPPQKRLF